MVPRLHSLRGLINRSVSALDDSFGSLYNVYLDQGSWAVGYFIIQTGSWLKDRKVLISPSNLRTPFWLEDPVHVDLSRQQIVDSPPIEAAKPVSRRQEELMNAYFGWPSYGTRPLTDAVLPTENLIETGKAELRSLREVIGYSTVGKADCDLGTVQDFIAEEPDWSVPFVMTEMGGAISRRRLVPTGLIERIDWAQKKIHVTANRRQIVDSPEVHATNFTDAVFREQTDRYYATPRRFRRLLEPARIDKSWRIRRSYRRNER